MTQRSILAGAAPSIIVHAGADVIIRAVEGERVTAETNNMWGMKVERKKDDIKVEIGASGEVLVPLDSTLKVYAGKNITVEGLRGEVIAYAGWNLTLRGITRLVHAQAGGSMDLECQSLAGKEARFTAGRNLRIHIHDLASARIQVKDIGGEWEALIGSGELPLILKAGGDLTLVTDQQVVALPPDFILGKIEHPQAH